MSELQPSPHVLVVDDDPNIVDVVRRYLEREGFDVNHARDGHEALDQALRATPDLVVLDLMLPGIDGLEVCRRLRALAPVPVIMLTARGDEADRVVGLELGADDYLAKPFSPRELMARVKAVLRRARGPLSPSGPSQHCDKVLTDGDLVVEVASRQARLGGEVLPLTPRELELLVFFMRNPQTAFRREDLLQHVWGYSYGDTSTVTVHVRRLRDKVEPDPAKPCRIATVWGVGYRWEGT